VYRDIFDKVWARSGICRYGTANEDDRGSTGISS
jgi:hypothetical protein